MRLRAASIHLKDAVKRIRMVKVKTINFGNSLKNNGQSRKTLEVVGRKSLSETLDK